jgi:hypothetical protein
MRNLYLSVTLACLVFSNAEAQLPLPNITPSQASGLSVISVLAIPLYPFVAVYMVLESASESKKPLKVTNVKKFNDHVIIEGVGVDDTPIAFKMDKEVAEFAKLEVNSDIKVLKTNLGYVLEANEISLGVISDNQNNFKRERI